MLDRVRLLSIAGAIALLPSAASAAELQKLAGDVSVLIGKWCNVIIVPAADGVLIIDDQIPSTFEETMEGVRAVSAAPVRYVIDTHWHLDHSGGNAVFAKTGATVIAQREVRTRRSTEQFLAAYNRKVPAGSPESLPSIVYDDALELHVGGETVSLIHAPHAHTDGDSIVRMQQANVIAMGDIFFNGIFPFIDRSSEGSVQGMIAAVDLALGMADEQTRIVPAHGPVATRADLKRYRDMLVAVTDKVRAGMKARKSKDDIIASHPAAAYREGMEGEEDRFVDAVYDSLAAEKQTGGTKS